MNTGRVDSYVTSHFIKRKTKKGTECYVLLFITMTFYYQLMYNIKYQNSFFLDIVYCSWQLNDVKLS